MISFLFGGVVGLLALTEKDTFLKDLVFIGAFAWLIWALLNPISTVGGNWVVKKTELLAIIAVVVIFIERDFWNIFNRLRKKKGKFGIGLLGVIALMIFLSVSGLSGLLFDWLGKNTIVLIIIVLAWFAFLYVMINKGVKKLLGRVVGLLEKK
jgi:hypothetical protein